MDRDKDENKVVVNNYNYVDLSGVTHLLNEILKTVNDNNLKLIKMDTVLANIQAQNAALQAAVAEEDSVIDSAIVLINGFETIISDLRKQLADAIAANDPTALQAVADAMGTTVDDIKAKKDALAAAVTTNTPAA